MIAVVHIEAMEAGQLDTYRKRVARMSTDELLQELKEQLGGGEE